MVLAVLLAVLAEHPFFGVGGPQEIVYCTLDFGRITSQGSLTYEARLAALLEELRGWAGADAPAVNPAYSLSTASSLELAIYDFVGRLGRPTVFLVDEVRGVLTGCRTQHCWDQLEHTEGALLGHAGALTGVC